MNKTLALILSFCMIGAILSAQTKRIARNSNTISISRIHAKSSQIDSSALGGFWESSNSPNPIPEDSFSTKTKFFVFIDTSKLIPIGEKYIGYSLFIGNKSKRSIQLPASDSKLYVIAEVFHKNKWQPIEYIQSSGCGNSYHNIYLAPEEYWKFEIVKYEGDIPTKLRYKIRTNTGIYAYSNIINASFNVGQLQKEPSLYDYFLGN